MRRLTNPRASCLLTLPPQSSQLQETVGTKVSTVFGLDRLNGLTD